MSCSGSPFSKLPKGALAGFIARPPMSASMLIGWRLLPSREKYPLPPRLITEEMSESGQIDPSFVVTHTFPLTETPHAYLIFQKKLDGCIQVLLKPEQNS